jgi:predicted PurR-regulated permease PerM
MSQPSPMRTEELRPDDARNEPNANIPAADPEQRANLLHSSVRVGTVSQIIVAIIATIGLIYLLKIVLVTILVSLLIAYVLEPPVSWLNLLAVPRWVGALIVVTITGILALGILYFSYNSAEAFLDQLPQYSSTLRRSVGKFRVRATKIENQARSIVEPAKKGEQPVPVRLEEPQGLAQSISETGEIILAIGFVPFLVYFMLVSKDHFHVATVRFFPRELRMAAHGTIGSISAMIREYVVANAALGGLNALVLIVVFWLLHINYFYFIGAMSGFLNLIPYLGVFLALLVPLAGGLGVLHEGGLIALLAAVLGLHLITMNVLYPKVIGQRLQLNALAVSISLLFWAWLWGAWGLVLAIPILGAVKITCDHIDPLWKLGAWLGNSSAEGKKKRATSDSMSLS